MAKAYISNGYSPTAVSVLDTDTNTISQTIIVGSNFGVDGPLFAAVSPDGTKVYVANTGVNTIGNKVTVIDTATNAIIATITVGARPTSLAITPDNTRVYVANNIDNTISVIDTSTNAVTATITAPGSSPHGIAVSPDGAKVYVTGNDKITIIKTSNNTIDPASPIVFGSNAAPQFVQFTPNGSYAYVSLHNAGKISCINTATNSIAATIIPVGTSFPRGLAITADGSKVYVSDDNAPSKVWVINTSTNTITKTITGVGSHTGVGGIAITPEGNYLYVLNNPITVINTSSDTVSTTLSVPSSIIGGNATFIGSSNIVTTDGNFMNKFRNGTMDIWQRSVSATTITTSGAYVPDGWIVVPTGASCTAQRTTANTRTGALSTYSLLMTGATSVTGISVKQRIESLTAQQLEGQQVTVQAQVYNNTGASITPTLTVKRAGSTDNWSSPTIDVNAVSLQACANGAWTRIAYTFASSTSSGSGLEITFDFGNNFSTTSKSVQITELDIRPTPGVSTGLNSNPPVPEMRPVQVELAICQRYLCKTFSQGVAPAQAVGLSTGEIFLISLNSTLNANFFIWQFPVTMRTAPTVTTYNPISANSNWRDTTANVDVTANSLGNYDNKAGFFVQGAISVSNNLRIHALATAEL